MKSTVDNAFSYLSAGANGDPAPTPGIVLIVDSGQASARALGIPRNGLLLGRGTPCDCFVDDDWISRVHLHVRRVAGCWVFEDPGSRNGSRLNGDALQGTQTLEGPVVIRMGRSLCWALDDASAHLRAAMANQEHQRPQTDNGPVLGGAMRTIWQEIEVAAKSSDTLLIGGPSGAGKELAAQAYHHASYGATTTRPFVAVNCATIPTGLAERLLFGATRGAYSGANADTEGFIQAANGGTLFLDELAELEPQVQAKLLRVLETREVIPLGASRAQPVKLRICGATLRDLRSQVAQGRFREDLYYRLGRPQVILPSLRERLDEMPLLAQRTLAQIDPRLSWTTGLIETCAVRPWPGNVREFIGEIHRAGYAALNAGETRVESTFLARDAGVAIESATSAAPAAGTGPVRKSAPKPDDDQIRAALAREQGNVSRAARALGMHRNQLRRWLDRQQASASDYKTDD